MEKTQAILAQAILGQPSSGYLVANYRHMSKNASTAQLNQAQIANCELNKWWFSKSFCFLVVGCTALAK